MSNWKEDLVKQFNDEFSGGTSSPAKTNKKPRVIRKKTKKRNSNVGRSTATNNGFSNTQFVLPLFLLVCILSITLVASYNFRKRGSVYASTPSHAAPNNQVLQDYQQDARRHQEYLFDQKNSEWKAQKKQFEDQTEEAIKEAWDRADTNRERVTLLGILYNNNLSAMREGTEDYIFINPDWTIDRYPSYLDLDKEDRKFLRKHVKK